jgi:3-hydroxyisobutyrate dehydrogenase-like beta-hydroxyacid dehydrogenase
MRIGYLGVGNMGQPMAGKLLDAGHDLSIYDAREGAMRPLLERQARQAASPKELADTCDTVIVSLPTLESFQSALSGPDGLLAGKALRTLDPKPCCALRASFRAGSGRGSSNSSHG